MWLINLHGSDLYMRVLEGIEYFSNVLERCMAELIAARSFKDPKNPSKEVSGNQVFVSIVTVLYEYAPPNHC